MSVIYTPGQLRDAVGIGQETYRHWKKVLTPLRKEAGHSPCFTAGDLLATAIVRTLVLNYAIQVRALSQLAYSVFAECNERSWPTLERSLLVLDLVEKRALTQPEGSRLTLERPAVVVPLRTMIADLRRTLLAGDDRQETLRFPPVVQPADLLRQRGGQA